MLLGGLFVVPNFIVIGRAGRFWVRCCTGPTTMQSHFRLKNDIKSEPNFDKIVNRFLYFYFEIDGGIKIFSKKIFAEKY